MVHEGSEKIQQRGSSLQEGSEKIRQRGSSLQEGSEKIRQRGSSLQEGMDAEVARHVCAEPGRGRGLGST